MPMPRNRDDREFEKFREVGGETAVRVFGAGAFEAPPDTDAVTEELPDAVTEIYRFRQGGASGTILMTVTVIYTDSTKTDLVSVVRT